MKILFLTDLMRIGGKERQLLELLKGLQERSDVECELVVLDDEIQYPDLQDMHVGVHCLKRKSKRDPSILIDLFRICRTFQPDFIHAWDSMSAVYAVPICETLRIKLANGMIRDASPVPAFGQSWIRARITFPFSDLILANSVAGLVAYRTPRSKSRCAHNGFDFSRTRKTISGDAVKRELALETSKVVGMVARFHVGKDYATYLQAAMQILSQRRDVTFLAVGDGETLQACRQLVLPEFQARIKFLGRRNDIESLVNIFDIGVLLSNDACHCEGIANSVMEYMAFAKPVVVTDGGGMRELVVNDQTGFLTRSGDLPSVVEKITFLLDHSDVADVMGARGRRRLLEEFSLEKMTDRYLDLYETCMS